MIYFGVSPVAFTIGSVQIAWYGIFVALAVLTVVSWALVSVRRGASISYETVISGALVGIPSAMIFSRLLHVIDYWDYYIAHPGEIIGGAGLSIYGAVLGAALGVWIYSRFSKNKFGYIADMIAPAIILGQAIGRVGCLFNGCCYGVETDIFYAIVYTNPDSLGPIGIPVHPTQIYEIIYNLIIFGVLLKLRNKFRPSGSLFLIYLAAYSAWRLGIDFIRPGRELLFGLHEAQLIAIVVLAISLTLLITRTRRIKKDDGELKGNQEVS